jgi:adenylosuccinate lyase
VGTRLTDSLIYRHSWTTPALDSIFEEANRLQSWLDILVALASSQEAFGIVPVGVAETLRDAARVEDLDLAAIADETRRTSHSTLGLIHGLQLLVPEEIREFVYFGATVQDLTDTWFGIAMRDTAAIIRADLVRVEQAAIRLARAHRDTPMPGRTHGQSGTPITFGFKAATWADEVSRGVERLDESGRRWAVGQLAGSTGGLAFFGEHGTSVRARFCELLGLADPGMSWTSTRDRVAEFGTVMAMVSSTLARIGNEIYELQRPEIGELGEPRNEAAVGSITMPHKRNPEFSEHLDTLARIARAASGVLVEGMVASHERDGRGWKAEWVMLPEVALTTGTSASLAATLVEGLEVNAAAMLANVRDSGTSGSEAVLVALSSRIGKHRAQALLHETLASLRGDENAGEVAALIAAATGEDQDVILRWMEAPATTGALIDVCLARLEDRER